VRAAPRRYVAERGRGHAGKQNSRRERTCAGRHGGSCRPCQMEEALDVVVVAIPFATPSRQRPPVVVVARKRFPPPSPAYLLAVPSCSLGNPRRAADQIQGDRGGGDL
jgi:hypothetical protein